MTKLEPVPFSCLLSIVIATFKDLHNLAHTLPKTLKVTSHTPLIEIIIKAHSSDAPTGKYLHDVLNSQANLRVITSPDTGLYDALNQAVKFARGTYVLILGSDDYLVADPFSLNNNLASSLAKEELIVYSQVFLNSTDCKSRLFASEAQLPLFTNVSHQGLIVPKKILVKYPFNTNYLYAADYENYLILRKHHYPWLFLENPFVVFSTNGISEKKALRPKLIGHSENIRALANYHVFWAISYLPYISFVKLKQFTAGFLHDCLHLVRRIAQ